MEHNNIIIAEFPPTHAFVQFFPDLKEPANLQMKSICDSLCVFKKEVQLDTPVDVVISILLDASGEGLTIYPDEIKRISELGVSLVINAG